MKILIKNYKIFIYLILLSFSFVSGKWIFSYLFFPNEDILSKILFEIYDFQYFPLIHSLGNLNFNPSYTPLDETLKFIPIPYANLLFHSIFIKIFGYFGFILLEFLCVLIFLYIFFQIFKKINFSNTTSLLLSTFIFTLPALTVLFDTLNFPHLESMHLQDFYTLRVPRPLISNLYLFAFLNLLIFFYKEKTYNNFLAFCFALLLSLMWGSVYYNFSLSAIALVIIIILNYKSQLYNNLKKNYKFVILIIFYFVIFSIPLLIILYLSEPDYMVRVGLMQLDLHKKSILLTHLFNSIASKKFILIFVLNSIALFYIKKKQNFYCSKSIEVFYIIFISSVLSPFLFIIFSPAVNEVYHFLNMAVVMSLICFFISFLVMAATFFESKSIKDKTEKFFQTKIIKLLIPIFFILFYNYQSFLHTKENNNRYFFLRSDFNEITFEIQKKNIKLSKETSIMSFNDMIHAWWILSNYKYLAIVNSIYNSRKTNEIENRIIYAFKFLKLNVDDFLHFFKNKKTGYRYLNKNVAEHLGYMKYQANSLVTFNNSQNFEEEIKNTILNTSPLYTQQLAIPKEEFERLRKKFLGMNTFNYHEPDLIIFRKDKNIDTIKKIIIDSKKFCKLINNTTYIVYIKNEKIENCKLID